MARDAQAVIDPGSTIKAVMVPSIYDTCVVGVTKFIDGNIIKGNL